jgi:hypothetical protein
MKPEEVFDLKKDEYVMENEVKKKYDEVDKVLKLYDSSLKHFFNYLGVGPWEGGCVVCRLVDVKQVKDVIASGVLDSIPFDGVDNWLRALEVLCPKLFTVVSLEEAHVAKGIRRHPDTGAVGDVLLCPITHALLTDWDIHVE